MKRFFNNPISIILLLVLVYMAVDSGALKDPLGWIQSLAVMIPGLLIGLTFHEFAHAAVAYKLGDDTPKIQNRVSLNPLRHIDVIGLVSLVLIGFGWGKAVEINPYNFKHPRRDEFFVSIAGVFTNFVLAFIFTGITVLVFNLKPELAYSDTGSMIYSLLYGVIWINLVLMVFNLIPIPPLDGFNILTAILDLKKYTWWYKVYNYGFVLLLLFIVAGFTTRLLVPAVTGIMDWMWSVFQFFVY